jgi:hypothetical protein
LEGCLGCGEVRADARGLRALLVGVELGLDVGLVGDRVGELVGVLERFADVGLCLVGAALPLEDGDLGLADPVRDGGRGVLEALDEAELLLEHVARLVGDGDVEAGEVDADACARVLAIGEGLAGDLAPRSGLERADVAVVALTVDAGLEGFGGVRAGCVDTVDDLHAELVAAGRCEPFCGGCEGFDAVLEPGNGFGGAGDGLLHAPLVAFPGGVKALEALDVAVGVGQLEQQRVAGADGFELGEGEHGFAAADVVDLAALDLAGHDLVDEFGLALERLPHDRVERSLGQDLRQLHLGVLVALADDAAVALGDVGGDLKLPTPPIAQRPGDAQRLPEILTVPKSPQLAAFIGDLDRRVEAIRTRAVAPEVDNMLKVSTHGRLAALDLRLVLDEFTAATIDPAHTKVEVAADKIAAVWAEHKDRTYLDPATGEASPIPGAFQLVFCDLSTPNPDRWNAYDALRDALYDRGLPIGSVQAALQAVTCATYNFETTSQMWTVLKEASEQPGVVVTVYVDGDKADAAKVKAQLPRTTIYQSAVLPNGKHVVSHAKFIVIDHEILLLTSANFSFSAENRNVEFGLLVRDSALAESVEATMTSKHGSLYELV